MPDDHTRNTDIKDFNSDFKEKYLDGKILSDEALDKIYEIFGARKQGEDYSMFCDEYHAHSYSCVRFKNPQKAVVDRLVQELRRYKEKIKDLKEKLGLDEF